MAVLFIHGSASSSMMWRPYLPLLEEPFAPVDLLGALGRPPVTRDADWSFDLDVAVAEAALLELDQPTDVLAHSYGGLVALHLALRHPTRVRQVIAHEPVCWPVFYAHHEGTIGDPVLLAWLLDPENAGGEAWMKHFIEWWGGVGSWAGLPERLRRMLCRGAWKTYLEVRSAMSDPTDMKTWAAFPVPLRMTVGEETPRPQHAVVETFATLVPDGLFVKIPGGHGAPISHRQGVLAAWLPWLQRT